MLKDIVAVSPATGTWLHIEFEDGAAGTIDIAALVPFAGVFAPLNDPAEFEQARVNRELGSVEWPCGADLDPDVLYAAITGRSIRAALGQSAA